MSDSLKWHPWLPDWQAISLLPESTAELWAAATLAACRRTILVVRTSNQGQGEVDYDLSLITKVLGNSTSTLLLIHLVVNDQPFTQGENPRVSSEIHGRGANQALFRVTNPNPGFCSCRLQMDRCQGMRPALNLPWNEICNALKLCGADKPRNKRESGTVLSNFVP